MPKYKKRGREISCNKRNDKIALNFAQYGKATTMDKM
mgnify:CR=1 FL=1